MPVCRIKCSNQAGEREILSFSYFVIRLNCLGGTGLAADSGAASGREVTGQQEPEILLIGLHRTNARNRHCVVVGNRRGGDRNHELEHGVGAEAV